MYIRMVYTLPLSSSLSLSLSLFLHICYITCAMFVHGQYTSEFHMHLSYLIYLTSTIFCMVSVYQEYCDTEIFRPNCDASRQVVVMQSAKYGRMKIGRCVEIDLGFIGEFDLYMGGTLRRKVKSMNYVPDAD